MNTSTLLLRQAKQGDLPEIQRLFVDTVCAVCKEDYTPEQIKVWTSSVEDTARWIKKINSQFFLLAELSQRLVGYASLENNDYLDFFYVHRDHQRQGIAGRLYVEIEKEALRRQATALHSDVSKTARPFFEKKGFRVVAPQTREILGVEITNFRMTRDL